MPSLVQIRQELRPTLALALPMIVGQASQMVIGLTDNAFIGRIGTVPLAAAAFTNSLFSVGFIVGVGLLLPVGVFTARDHGAGDEAGCGAWLRHGRVLALAVGGGAFLLLLLGSTQLAHFGQPPEVVAVMRPFFRLIALSLVPVLYFQMQRGYLDALGRPWVGTIIMLADIGLNALLNWIFINGHLGAPALGLTGAGLATLLARSAAVAVIAVWIGRERRAADPLEGKRFRELLHLGVPAAGCLLFESGAFSSAALMMGWLGATALAAHQIALGCVSLTFMFPLGLSLATSIRISKTLGAGQPDRLRAIGFGALGLSTVVMLAFGAVFVAGGVALMRGFSTDPAVVALAAQLMLLAAVFQPFDGGQVVSAGALRGLTDVRVPTVITFIAYWIIALPLGYVLAFHTALGPRGVWAGLGVGLAFAAAALAWRFHLRTRRATIA